MNFHGVKEGYVNESKDRIKNGEGCQVVLVVK